MKENKTEQNQDNRTQERRDCGKQLESLNKLLSLGEPDEEPGTGWPRRPWRKWEGTEFRDPGKELAWARERETSLEPSRNKKVEIPRNLEEKLSHLREIAVRAQLCLPHKMLRS